MPTPRSRSHVASKIDSLATAPFQKDTEVLTTERAWAETPVLGVFMEVFHQMTSPWQGPC